MCGEKFFKPGKLKKNISIEKSTLLYATSTLQEDDCDFSNCQ